MTSSCLPTDMLQHDTLVHTYMAKRCCLVGGRQFVVNHLRCRVLRPSRPGHGAQSEFVASQCNSRELGAACRQSPHDISEISRGSRAGPAGLALRPARSCARTHRAVCAPSRTLDAPVARQTLFRSGSRAVSTYSTSSTAMPALCARRSVGMPPRPYFRLRAFGALLLVVVAGVNAQTTGETGAEPFPPRDHAAHSTAPRSLVSRPHQ